MAATRQSVAPKFLPGGHRTEFTKGELTFQYFGVYDETGRCLGVSAIFVSYQGSRVVEIGKSEDGEFFNLVHSPEGVSLRVQTIGDKPMPANISIVLDDKMESRIDAYWIPDYGYLDIGSHFPDSIEEFKDPPGGSSGIDSLFQK